MSLLVPLFTLNVFNMLLCILTTFSVFCRVIVVNFINFFGIPNNSIALYNVPIYCIISTCLKCINTVYSTILHTSHSSLLGLASIQIFGLLHSTHILSLIFNYYCLLNKLIRSINFFYTLILYFRVCSIQSINKTMVLTKM